MNPSPKALVVLALAVIQFALGFALAWNWQGRALDAAQSAFETYVTVQDTEIRESRAAATKLHKETSDAWARNLERVRGDADAFRRCVAAGRCGPAADRVRDAASVPAADPGAVPSAGGTDAADGGGSVPASGGLAADCAVTQLKLNTLRTAIRGQRGY